MKILKASGIAEYQMVRINNVSNGVCWETYTVGGEWESGVVCLNGPPARHFQPGDIVIIVAEGFIERSEKGPAEPTIVIVKDNANKDFEIKPHKKAMLSNKA
jgi:aspartate 1-decarboxylase